MTPQFVYLTLQQCCENETWYCSADAENLKEKKVQEKEGREEKEWLRVQES